MKDSLIPEQDKEDKSEAHKAEFVGWIKISSNTWKLVVMKFVDWFLMVVNLRQLQIHENWC